MAKTFMGVDQSIMNFIKANESWFEKVKKHHDAGEDPKKMYESWKTEHKNDVLQALQITAEYTEFFCENDETLAIHLGNSMLVWKDLIDGYVAVLNDDTYP